MIKKIIIVLVLLFTSFSFSQNKQLLYNFAAIPQSLLINPAADIQGKWYVGVPLLSEISLKAGSSGLSAFSLFEKNNISLSQKLQNIMKKVSYNDHLSLNEQIEVLNIGFRLGTKENNIFASFGVYQELDALMYVPTGLINSAVGNASMNVINLNDFNAKAEMLTVYHIGLQRKINNKLIVGARAKLYSSIINLNSTTNSGNLTLDISGSSIDYQFTNSSSVIVNTSGVNSSNIKDKVMLGENIGLGFDAGITYYLQKNQQFTLSVIDVGYVKHTKAVENFSIDNSTFSSSPQIQGFFENVKKAFNPEVPNTKKYTTLRPLKLNSSYEYSFDEDRSEDVTIPFAPSDGIYYKSAVGAQLFMMTTPKSPLYAFTTYYKRNFSKKLQMKATYTLDSYSFTNLGMGLSTKVGPVNFYLLADNLLAYSDISKAKSLSFQLGLNILFKE